MAAFGESLLLERDMKWSADQIEFLTKMYPQKGLRWCAEQMGMRDAQIRAKASQLRLKARGTSEAWKEKNEKHAEIMRGRKRPDQSVVMKNLHAQGKLRKTTEQKARLSERTKDWIRKNGHPKGSKGLKHSDATKTLISQKSIAAAKKKTEEDWHARTVKAMATRERNGTQLPMRVNATWKAGWREIGGVMKFYRSRWEANYARYLEWLRERGEIVSWRHEPKTFWFDGIKRGCVSYLPDFEVVEACGKVAYHEVKGWMDDRSATKIKRMAKYHPEVTLIVIAKKEYRKIELQVSRLIAGWEANT